MNLIRKILFSPVPCRAAFLAALLLCFITSGLTSQSPQKPSRQSSLEAFSKGDYELAYSQFSELLVSYPGDPVYKYYSGVCLIKLNREPEKAAALLKQSLQGSAAIRSIPQDVHFWLGRAQHLSGKFNEAIGSYNSFTDLNGRKAARELGIPDYIEQCERKEGVLAARETEVVKVKEKPAPPAEKPRVITAPADSVSVDYDNILSDALDLQYRADSVYKAADEQRKGLEQGSYAERTKLKEKIAGTEALADSLQREADKKYDEAQAAMNKKPFTEEQVNADTVTEPPEPEKKPLPPEPLAEEAAAAEPDTLKPAGEQKPDEEKTTLPLAPPAIKEVFSEFEVMANAPDGKIEINPVIPAGLVFRIQTAVFRNPVAYSYFKGIVPVKGFTIPGRDLTVYYSGMFRRSEDADKSLALVRKLGFRDAFVAALFEGKAVTAERAALLEKEWGMIPLYSVASEQAPADTVPPTLTFRVEVLRSAKPVKDDVAEGIKRIAGSRGLEIIMLEDKTAVYLIGTFITYESAEEYSDLLIRNGYENAKVGAWLGKKEIPLETAIELFERIE